MTAATAAIAARIAAAWRPRERLRTPEWCVRNVRLPAEFGIPGRFDLDDYPFWREPLEAVDDPDVYSIVMMTGTQIGKTEVVKAILASQSDIDPAPQMLVGPDKDYVSELREKIYRTAEINPAIAARIPPRRLWNLRWLDFGTCYCYLAWTGNTQRVSGKAVKLVVCSEVDRFKQPIHEGAIAKLIEERVKSFTRYKIIKESTPTDDTSKIALEYSASDQRTYHVPCPHCGRWQALRFFPHREGPHAGRGGVAGLQHADGAWKTPEEVVAGSYYVCERGCRIISAEKPEMVGRGRWVPKGQTIADDGRLEGKPLRGGRQRGYQLGSIYARSITFGRMAAAYLDARAAGDLGLKSFFNNWLGLPYKVRAKVPKWQTLGKRLAGGHRRGTVPPGALFLTAGVDVQQDRCYWVVRAWGAHADSWLVDWGVCSQVFAADGLAKPSSDLDQLVPEVLNRPWPLVAPNVAGQTSLAVRLAGLDTGYEPHRVWDWVRTQPGDRVRAVAGDPHEGSTWYRMSVVERSARDGKPYAGGMQRWAINTDTAKLDLQERWSRQLGERGTWLLTGESLEVAENYLRQITNEGRVAEVHAKSGRVKMVWQVIDPAVGNHYWDCEVYNRALAEMVAGGEWSDLEVEAKRLAARSGRDAPQILNPGQTRPDGRAWLD